MTNIGKWSATSLSTVMSTELNSLANGSSVVSSSSYDNTSNLNIYVDIEVNLASLSPSPGGQIVLYIAESVDGTNFPSQSTADFAATTTQYLATVPVGSAASTAQRVVVRQVLIPPTKFFVYALNSTGVALASSGNTVKFITYSLNLNG